MFPLFAPMFPLGVYSFHHDSVEASSLYFHSEAMTTRELPSVVASKHSLYFILPLRDLFVGLSHVSLLAPPQYRAAHEETRGRDE